MEHSIGFEKLNSPTIVIDKEEEGEKAPYKREHRVYSLPKAFDFSIATLPQSEMAFKPSPLASEKRHFSDSRRKHHSWDEDDYVSCRVLWTRPPLAGPGGYTVCSCERLKNLKLLVFHVKWNEYQPNTSS